MEFNNKPYYVPDISLNCFFSPDTNFSIKLFYSKSPYFSNNFSNIENANIRIYNSMDTITLIHSHDGFYFGNKKPRIDIRYFLNATIENSKTLMAESFIPSSFKIISLNTESDINEEDNQILKIHLKINVSNPVSYITLRHIVEKKILSIEKDTIVFRDTSWISALNNNHSYDFPENLNRIALFSFDKPGIYYLETNSFGGFKKNDNLLEGTSIFEIFDCSFEYFEYLKTDLLYNSIDKEAQTTIINPNSIYSNIMGGNGIFAGYRKIYISKKFQ